MAKDRQGLHFSELVWESTEQNMAIPPRSSAEAAIPVKPPAGPGAAGRRKSSGEETVQLQLWDMEETAEPVTTTEGQFVHRARELAEHKEPAALFVPFKSYWPTYGHMTGAQSRWYFFWRDEVRQGRYPKTDLSYIFLNVYELLNGVGWDEPLDGCRQLNLLWEAYRDQYKRLDQYLGGWIADFSFVHKLEIPLTGIVARSRGLAGDLAELELVRCLSSAPEQLSFEVLTVMSDYDISKSKFYLGDGKAAAERYIPQVVALIDAYVARKHGSNLITMFPPGPSVVRERYLFRSAVYDISLYGYSVLVPVVRISKSPPLRSLITRLFRLTENKLRALMGYRGRLKDVKVDADMEELVTRFLEREFRKAEQEEKGPAVVIDQRRLEQLETDSEVVRALLTVEEAAEQLGTGTTEDAHDKQNAEDTDLDGANTDNKDRILEAAVEAAEAAVEETVEAAMEKVVEAAAKAAVVEKADTPYPSGDPEADSWMLFAAALSPLQCQALLALAEEAGPAKVQRLAAGGGTMAELLFDEINELAMDMLGDLIIDGEELTEESRSRLHYIKR
ncbi:TerB N-terminal domain-containing protein [Paenibacillus sp. MMS20-IR301]|uniref:TerB N-terminal domain-containing protein n=1 Tax=Paenibacillus sp. MMS20-IR301 TaxID=2895946 RepID=UPI0028ED85C2|nr:TerB N-terminal domain-containing protein [Paenibacillus sp. MMS20-IR301]WNS45114.1 TerB N-terminal domain-containing protein [Paenibacillus sp. MMS20-IR301]